LFFSCLHFKGFTGKNNTLMTSSSSPPCPEHGKKLLLSEHVSWEKRSRGAFFRMATCSHSPSVGVVTESPGTNNATSVCLPQEHLRGGRKVFWNHRSGKGKPLPKRMDLTGNVKTDLSNRKLPWHLSHYTGWQQTFSEWRCMFLHSWLYWGFKTL
jgi:hypothetical protein